MKCSFCSREVGKGAGYLHSKKDGTTSFFCSSKCRNNQLGLKRVGKKASWVRRKKSASETKKAKASKPAEKPTTSRASTSTNESQDVKKE